MARHVVSDTKLDCEHLLGQFLDERHYDTLVQEDMDFYAPPGVDGIVGEQNCIFMFRKNFFSEEQQKIAYDNMSYVANILSDNRGTAAGTGTGFSIDDPGIRKGFITKYQEEMMDAIMSVSSEELYESEDPISVIQRKYPTDKERKLLGDNASNYRWVTVKTEPDGFIFDGWVERMKSLPTKERQDSCRDIQKYISSSSYGAAVHSNIAGFMDRFPRLPYCRGTRANMLSPNALENSVPFFARLDEGFAQFLPERYAAQRERASRIDNRFVVPGTVFTTITVNKNFRTAAHRDAGDLSAGFSNLTVVTNGKNFSGGYLILPEYRIAVDIRPGDLLLINNHEGIHGNTPIVEEEPGASRISFVCYFREKMSECESFEIENARYEFVKERSVNVNHPGWRPRWNGVSEGMWQSDEWFEYRETKLGIPAPKKSEDTGLEDMFA